MSSKRTILVLLLLLKLTLMHFVFFFLFSVFQTEDNSNSSACTYTLRTDTLFKSHSVSFQLGLAGTDVTMDGRRVDYVFSRPAANKLLEIQTSGGKTTRLARIFYPDRMEVEMEENDDRASSVFERAEQE